MSYEPRMQDQPKLDERFILHLPADMKRSLMEKAGRSRRSAADLAREGISRVLDTAA